MKDYIENNSKFVFSGWNAAVTPVSDDALYSAVYLENVLVRVPEGMEGNVTLGVRGSAYTVATDCPALDFAGLLGEIPDTGRLEIKYASLTLTFDGAAVANMREKAVIKIEINAEYDKDGNLVSFIFFLKNKIGNAVPFSGEIRVSAAGESDSPENLFIYGPDGEIPLRQVPLGLIFPRETESFTL